MDRFVQFEIVVWWEKGNGSVDIGVVENLLWNGIQGSRGAAWLCYCECREK